MKNFKDIAIRRKLTIIQLVTAFTAVLMCCAFFVYNDIKFYKEASISNKNSIAEIVGINAASALEFLDKDAATDMLLKLKRTPAILNAVIFDKDGREFSRYNKPGENQFSFPLPGSRNVEMQTFFGQRFLVTYPISDKEFLGTVMLRSEISGFNDIILNYIKIAAIILFASLVASLLISGFLQGIITDRLLLLVNKTKQIAETGNYSIRASIEGRDEIGILSLACNNMLEQIEKTKRNLDEANAGLEKQVELRTAQLENTNKELNRHIHQLKENEDQLRASEEKFRNLIQYSPVGIVLTTMQGKIIEANPVILDMMGFGSKEELMNAPATDYYVDNNDREKMLNLFKEDGFVRNFEFRVKKKNAEPIWLSNSMTSFKTANNETLLLSASLDITQIKKAEKQIHELNVGLEKRVAEKTAELMEAELQFKEILDNLMEGATMIGFDWQYKYANNTASKQTGYSAEELVGHTIMEKYPGVEQTKTYDDIKRCLNERIVVRNEIEFNFLNGNAGCYEVIYQPVPQGVFILSTDISERKNAEERLRLALEAGKIGWWELDMVNDTSIRSQLHDEIFGYKEPLKEWGSKNFFDHVFPDDRPVVQEAFEAAQSTCKLDIECRIVCPDQTIKWIIVKGEIKNIHTPAQSMLGIVIDITERKNAEQEIVRTNEELRELSSHLQNVREEERINIAREIHDDLGQQLTGLKMDMFSLAKKTKSTDEIVLEKTKSIIHLIDEIVKSVRRIASNLRPSILDDLGLIAALVWHGKEVERRAEIKVSFSAELEEAVPGNITTGLFRIYQEALTNAVRHANAHEIISSLQIVNRELILTIKDDGKGMDLDTVSSKKTLGLIGIKERTFILGGKCDLISEPGSGTELRVSVPL